MSADAPNAPAVDASDEEPATRPEQKPDTDTEAETPTQRLMRYEQRSSDAAENSSPTLSDSDTATQRILAAQREHPEPSPAHGEWAEPPAPFEEPPNSTADRTEPQDLVPDDPTAPSDQPTEPNEINHPEDVPPSEPDNKPEATPESPDPNPVPPPDINADQVEPSDTEPDKVTEIDSPPITQDYYTNIPEVEHRPFEKPAFDGPPTREQAVQGEVGDCGIISTFGAVAGHRPEAIQNAVVDRGDGTFDITLHQVEPATPWNPVATPTGETTTYRVSNELPFKLNDPDKLAGSRPTDCSWPALYEKLIAGEDQTWDQAKRNEWEQDWQDSAFEGRKADVDADRQGAKRPPSPDSPPLGYNRIDLGSNEYDRANILARMIGEEAEVRRFPDEKHGAQALLKEFSDQLSDGKPVLVGSRGGPPSEPRPFPFFEFEHAYEVAKIDGDRIHLRNPWGAQYTPPPINAQTFLEYYRKYNPDGTRYGLYTTLK
ncbi:hypothetical protein [Nocardia concava]|uniref:hypothetical protein n=1 Tax=Nocardia concava TaxID=257281 RepID=UPI0002F6014F|nr:hypothetical protein [Nocardia concava]